MARSGDVLAHPVTGERLVWGLAAAALVLIAGPEIAYVRDEFAGTEFVRMNTVFKMGYQAWLLLAVTGAVVIAAAEHWLSRLPRLAWGVVRRHEHVPHLEVHRASRVVVRADREHPRELDGDVIDPSPVLAITVRQRALELCVPQPERSADLSEGSERL